MSKAQRLASEREGGWTQQALTASVAAIASAGALALLRYGAPEPHDVWFYPAGLMIGFGFGTIWDAVNPT